MQTKTLLMLGTLAATAVIAVELPRWLAGPVSVAGIATVEICTPHGSESLARLKASREATCGAQVMAVRKTVNGYQLVAEGVSTAGNALRLARVADEYINRQKVRQSADALRSSEIARTRLEMNPEAVSPHQLLEQSRNRQAQLESELLVLRHEYKAVARQLQAVNIALDEVSGLAAESSPELASLKTQREQQQREVARWEAVVREEHPLLVQHHQKLAALETRIANLQSARTDRNSERHQVLRKEQAFLTGQIDKLKSALAALESKQQTIEREIELAMERIVRDREILVPDWKPLAVRPELNGIPAKTLSPEQPEKAPRGMSSSVLSLGTSY